MKTTTTKCSKHDWSNLRSTASGETVQCVHCGRRTSVKRLEAIQKAQRMARFVRAAREAN